MGPWEGLLTPTEVTYGQVDGNEGLKAPDFPSLYTPPAHWGEAQHWPLLPATPLSPLANNIVIPCKPSFIYLSNNVSLNQRCDRDELTRYIVSSHMPVTDQLRHKRMKYWSQKLASLSHRPSCAGSHEYSGLDIRHHCVQCQIMIKTGKEKYSD